MRRGLDRRKMIAITAAAAGGSFALVRSGAQAEGVRLVEWTGPLLGYVAAIRLYHPHEHAGHEIIRGAVAEVRRLETIFSLYRRDSVLSELNRVGVLVAPPAELVDVMGLSERIWHETAGRFDPTVQPLWQCYADHFSSPAADATGPPPDRLAGALERTGWEKVHASRDRIVLGRGMALTLNGIAPGYITDRLVDRLRAAGLERVLVDMGEIRTLGRHPDGRPWQVGLRATETRVPTVLQVVDQAVATSAAEGFRFDTEGRCNHLFDPRDGRCAEPARAITVVAPSAAAADAFSTALALMSADEIARVRSRFADMQVHVTSALDRGNI